MIPPAIAGVPVTFTRHSTSTASRAATSPAGLSTWVCAPARSARVTRMAASTTIRAITMIPAETSNPRENPTASAWW